MQMTILPSPFAVAQKAADQIVKRAQHAITDRGVFVIALSGGSTPKKLYELLASADYVAKIDWSKVHFFVSDERFVPHSDDQSNQKLAEDNLLARIPCDRAKVHPVPVDLASPELAAAAYQKGICSVLGKKPVFDVILLGMGSDAHTASLFPGKDALLETKKLVTSSSPGILPPPVDRVTFTFPLINAARCVMLLTAGEDKAPALRAAKQDWDHPEEPAQTPTGSVRPQGELLVLADQAAVEPL